MGLISLRSGAASQLEREVQWPVSPSPKIWGLILCGFVVASQVVLIRWTSPGGLRDQFLRLLSQVSHLALVL